MSDKYQKIIGPKEVKFSVFNSDHHFPLLVIHGTNKALSIPLNTDASVEEISFKLENL